MKRGNPDLLDIPFAFDSLPQVDIEKFESEGYTSTIKKRSLMKLMDYTSSASFSSFESLEYYFKSKNYDSKEEIYGKFDKSCSDNDELIAQNIDLKRENEKLKKDIDKLLSSNSWKVTEPLRKLKFNRKN